MPLPKFLIIGTAKAGTTSLQLNLQHHPELHIGTRIVHPIHGPEWHHFFRYEDCFALGSDWYSSLFDDYPVLGDRCTDLLGYTESHARIHATIPNAKLIVCLREPVARAYSHWNHFNKSLGNRNKLVWNRASFEEVMGLDSSKEPPWYHQELKWFGHYAEQLINLFKYFSREQVLVLIAERVLQDMASQYNRVYSFLGLEAPSTVEYCIDNTHKYDTSINPETRDALLAYYRPHNELLRSLLQDELSEWN